MTVAARNSWLLSLATHLVLLGVLLVFLPGKSVDLSEVQLKVELLRPIRQRSLMLAPFRRVDLKESIAEQQMDLDPSSHLLSAAILPHSIEDPVVLEGASVSMDIPESLISFSLQAEPLSGLGVDLQTRSPGHIQRQRGQIADLVRPTPILETRDVPESTLVFPQNVLERIASDAISTATSDRLDIVFLIDASQSMEDNIRMIAVYLDGMVTRLSDSDLDVQFGVVSFRYSSFFSLLGWSIEVEPLTRNVQRIKRSLREIECLGGERALDAIMAALRRVQFRSGSERRMILVTDEYVSGTISRAEVLRAIREAKIHMDVIGRDEPFQHQLADFTGGMWQSIQYIDN